MNRPEVPHGLRRKWISGQLRSLLVLSWYSLKSQLRTTSTVLLGFMFPLAFIAVFSFVGGEARKLRLGLVEDDTVTKSSSIAAAVRALPEFEVVARPGEELEGLLRTGKLDGIIRYVPAPEATGSAPRGQVLLSYSTTSPQSGAIARLAVDMVVHKANLRLGGVEQPSIGFEARQVEAQPFRYVDFALPGQLGFSLLALAVSGMAFSLTFLRNSMVLKRIFVTPTWHPLVLLGQALSRLVVVMLNTTLLLLCGVLFFKFHLAHGVVTFLRMLALSMFGLLTFLGFGLLIAARARSTESVSPLANLFTLPQLLLCGTFFATEQLPAWLQPIANHLPLTYFNVAMRKVANEGASLWEVSNSLLGLAAWSVVAYVLAVRSLRWTP